MTGRRRPRRAGVLNVWEYDSQVFEFGDGRLALRGRNGSGKSNALSLLFPFVLDGVMSAQRMDPMGGARSMRSLLLCRDDDDPTSRFRYDSRTGYVWMEFDGGAGPLTIGIGASATAQRPDAHAWFFVTARRVDVDLDLEVEGRPRSQRELAAELDEGEVFTSAEEYRAVVDRELFGVGPVRYRKLVDLLLVLRRPHLAGKLDPDNVSGTLSAGLAALDPGLITDVARSFDDLEATQQELHDVRTSLAVLERFLPVYVDHLVHHVRRRATEVVSAHNELRRLRSDRTAAEAERVTTDETVRVLDAEIAQLGRAIAGDDVEIEAILASPAYRAAGLLDEVGKAAGDARDHADAAADRAETAAHDAERSADRAALAVAGVEQAEKARGETERAVRDQAAAGGLEIGTEPPDPAVVRATAAARRNDLRQVRAAVQTAFVAAQLARERGDDVTSAESSHDTAVARSHDADVLERTARAELGAAVTHWADVADVAIGEAITAATSEGRLVAPRLGSLIAVEDVSSGLGPALALAAHERVEPLRRAVGEVDAEAFELHRRLTAEHDDLTAERERVRVEPNPGPAVPTTRPDAADTARSGAPLYACVDFRSDVPAEDRAGWEAALHAAGVLDARVFADGRADDALDATLRPSGTPTEGSTTLADLFVAVPCNGVGADTIDLVLRSVPLDSDVMSLHIDGRWRVGPVAGRFHKGAAEFIGHEARERRRAERLAELDQRVAAVHGEMVSSVELRRLLDDVRSTVDRALDALPSTTALERAIDECRAAAWAESGALETLERAVAEAERAAAAAQEADGAMRSLAVRHRLGTTEQALDATDEALAATDRVANDLSAAIDRFGERRHTSEQAETDRIRAIDWAAESAAQARALAAAADDQQRRLDTLRSEVGADAAEAQHRLATARDRRRVREGDRELRRKDLSAAEIKTDRLRIEIARLDDALGTSERRAERVGAELNAVRSAEVIEALRSSGVGAIDVAEADDAATTLRAARAALDATDEVEDGATNRMIQAFQQQLLDGLRAGHDPQLTNYDDVAVVRVVTVDGLVGVGRLVDGLRTEAAKLESLLSERERQIFETHLLTRVSEALRDLLTSADEFEERINQQMAAAPTESGMRVELKWELVTDRPRTKEAMALLRFSPEMLGPEQREQLRAFFAAGIDEARAADPGRSFADTLAEVLDYRAWHRFSLYARFGDGQRQQMTRAFFRGLSGGEAATVLHLPLFAAAAAHYITCDEAAPRLIALDEAFAGIDERMRGRLMGLLVALDLDVLLTSHEFWGTYPEVPEIVVYDLMRRPPSPGVSAQQFTWRAGTVS